MQVNVQETHSRIKILIKILPIFAFIIPFIILYLLYPASFEATWKGRTYYIFFLWILSLEMILNWEKLRPKNSRLRTMRNIIFIVSLVLPTAYVFVANYTSLNAMIIDVSPKHYGDPFWAKLMPLSVEYLVFAALFAFIILTEYGIRGLNDFSISLCLIAAIGSIYVIDNLYPYGQFTPFQIFVPTTASLASSILNLMGYRTQLFLGESMPLLKATSPSGVSWAASIGWPCSGVESLLIYTLIIILFLKRINMSWVKKAAFFAVGAVITYFINALRIVTIFTIALNNGDWSRFHDYYGQLYSITWIVSYPLIILGSRALWTRIKDWRTNLRYKSTLLNQDKNPTQPAL